MTRNASLLAATSLMLLGSACAQTEAPEEDQVREVFFDGAEIEAVLEQNPDTTFFADVRDGTINHFDQTEAPIDFSRFVFQCPSMPAPVPMQDILEHIDEDTYTSEYWSVQSAPPSEEQFRRAPAPDEECSLECPPMNPDDCMWVCHSL